MTESTHKADTGRKGVDGKEIIIDIAFEPHQYALNYAEVHQIPVELGHMPITQRPIGAPGYGPIRRPVDSDIPSSTDLYAIGGVYQYKYVDDIVPEVQVGDLIYFRPRTLNQRKNCMGALKGEDGKIQKYIYKVPYENILCAVRDNKIIMIGGWVLLSPIYEDWKDLLIPTYYDFTDKEGNKMQRPKKEWIQKKVAPEYDTQRAVVEHIGKPLKGEWCDITAGETVIFKKQMKVFFQHIEGKKYIVLSQDQILAEVAPEVKVGY